MRKPLIALSLALSAGLGATTVADALAASPSGSTHTKSSPISANDTGTPSRNNAVSGAQIVQTAFRYLGYRYTATGNSPSTGFSCIGFVSYVYRSLGIPLPGDLGNALAFSQQVPFSQLQPGDILFFQNTVWNGLSHAAIYIGGGKFIHAEWYNRGVVVSSFNNDPVDGNYWISKYLTATRPWQGVAGAPVVTTPVGGVTVGVSTTTQAVIGGSQGVVVADGLNVRSGPSKNFGVTKVVPQNTQVTIIGKSHGWYKVELPDGTIGWVVKSGVGTASSVTGVNGVQQQVAANPTVGNSSAPARQNEPARSTAIASARVTASGLRVHSSPSMAAPVVTSVSYGQRLLVLAKSNGWAEVRTPTGIVGWVMTAYTTMSAAHPATAGGTTVLNSVAAPVVSHRTTRVTASGLRVHSAPSLSAPVVTSVGQGQQLQVLSSSNGWLHVRTASGQIGWVMAGYTSSGSSRTSATATASSKHFTGGSVVTSAVRVHATASLNGRVIFVLAAGQHVQVLSRSGGWVLARLPSGQTGYIYGSFLR